MLRTRVKKTRNPKSSRKSSHSTHNHNRSIISTTSIRSIQTVSVPTQNVESFERKTVTAFRTKHSPSTVSRKSLSRHLSTSSGLTSEMPSHVRFSTDKTYNFLEVEPKWHSIWGINVESKYSNPPAHQDAESDRYGSNKSHADHHLNKVKRASTAHSEHVAPPTVQFVERQSIHDLSPSRVEFSISPSHDVEESVVKSPFIDPSRPSFYSLSMFPYPSGNLHMGHVRVYTISDSLSRYYALRGYNVLHPMGWDAFGLPAENAARSRNVSPSVWTYSNIKHMRSQLNSLGYKFHWDREVATCHPDYYKWTQWLFLQLYHNNLAYRKKATVNWDPIDQTVLANEQVDAEGRSWRSGAIVEKKELDQWFFKITDYAEDLLSGLDTLKDWPSTVKVMQSQWIGKKNSAQIHFSLPDLFRSTASHLSTESPEHPVESDTQNDKDGDVLAAFTTRPDTILGVTYVGILPTHSHLHKVLDQLETRIRQGETIQYPLSSDASQETVTLEWIQSCRDFAQQYHTRRNEHAEQYSDRVIPAKHRGTKRTTENAPPPITSGFKTPITLKHPITGDDLPVYMADYVEEGRGTGVVMGVPAHDNNDFGFAKTHRLPVKMVIKPPQDVQWNHDIVNDDGYVKNLDEYVPHTSQTGSMMHSTSATSRSRHHLSKTHQQLVSSTPLDAAPSGATSTDAATGSETQTKGKKQKTGAKDSNTLDVDNKPAESAALDVIDYLERHNIGKSTPSYQLHDWLVSRQRYWGTPIPMIHCTDCGIQPVPEEDLPIKLPEGIPLDVKGRSVLASDHPNAVAWRQCACPNCGNPNAERETDTLDTFIDSSWYFLRYLSDESERAKETLAMHDELPPLDRRRASQQPSSSLMKNSHGRNISFVEPTLDAVQQEQQQQQQQSRNKLPWNKTEHDHLYPVTQYIGGIEHAILHLLYSRFISYFLHDKGLVSSREPFSSLLTQGMVHGESFKDNHTGFFIQRDNVILVVEDGKQRAFKKVIDPSTGEESRGEEVSIVWEKMSKSKLNGVDPDDMVRKYGADVCRMFVMFKAPPEKVLDWDERSVQGIARWVNRLWAFVNGYTGAMEHIHRLRQSDQHQVAGDIELSSAIADAPHVNFSNDADISKVLADIASKHEHQPLLTQMSKKDAQMYMKQHYHRDLTSEESELLQRVAVCVDDVTLAMETRAFNVGIAKLMTLSNQIFDFIGDRDIMNEVSTEWALNSHKLISPVFRESVLMLFRLLSPIAPHLATEAYGKIQSSYMNIPFDTLVKAVDQSVATPAPHGKQNSLHLPKMLNILDLDWPTMDSSWSVLPAKTVMQMNGKLLFDYDASPKIFESTDVLSALLEDDGGFGQLLQDRMRDILSDKKLSDEKFSRGTLESACKRVIVKSMPSHNKVLVNLVV